LPHRGHYSVAVDKEERYLQQALSDWTLADAERSWEEAERQWNNATLLAHLLGSIGAVGCNKSLRGEPTVLIKTLANGLPGAPNHADGTIQQPIGHIYRLWEQAGGAVA
jgi:hypothetical protein